VDAYAESALTDDAEPTFCWTQCAGHGPGPELLGAAECVPQSTAAPDAPRKTAKNMQGRDQTTDSA
jgi:hypothetical protein